MPRRTKETVMTRTAAILLLAFSAPLAAQEELVKLVPSSISPGDLAGKSVALSETRAVLGATGFDDPVSSAGAVWVFRESAGAWTQETLLQPNPAVSDGWFGESVAIEGSLVAVGSPQINDAGPGVVYLFKPGIGGWVTVAKLAGSDVAIGGQFGRSVAIRGGRLVVGAPEANAQKGAVYVFQDVGVGWLQTAKLTASGGGADDRFGASVAIDGDRILVGAPYASAGPVADAGAAYLFELQGSTWAQTLKLVAQTPFFQDGFGEAVALDGDVALVGVPYWDAARGAVDVFAKPSAFFPFAFAQRLTTHDPHPLEAFGREVALAGNRAVIASGKQGLGVGLGAAHVFTLEPSGWYESAVLQTASEPSGQLANGVAIHGARVLAGDPLNDEGGSAAGAAYLFDAELIDPLGCTGLNPAGSLVELGGVPAIGETWTLGVHNPLGTQAPGSLAFVALAASGPYPKCGLPIPGWGMAGGAGELLISIVPTPVLAGPVAWDGVSPAPVPIALPPVSALVGYPLYAQGAMSGAPGSTVGFALAGALKTVVGAPAP
jgi:hypothetical protein